jgi:translocation and assembly module TamB
MTDLPDTEGPRAPVDADRSAHAGSSDPDPAPSRRRTTAAPALQPTRRQRALRIPNPHPFAGVPLVVLLLLLWLAATQSGLRTLLDLATELFPDRFQVGRVEGRLIDRIALGDLSIQLPAFALRVGRIDLVWSPLRAFGGVLSIAEVRALDIDLILNDRVRDAEDPVVLPDLLLPLRLDLGSALVERVQIFAAEDDRPVAVVERAEVSGRLDAGLLVIDQAAVALAKPAFEAQGSGQARLSDAYPLNLVLNWELRPTRSASFQGHTGLDGDLAHLRVRTTATGSADLDLDVEIRDPLGRPEWNGVLKLMALNPAELIAALDMDADPERWSGLLDLRVASRGRLAETGPALTATLEALSGALRGYPVSATGGFDLAEGRLAIDAFRVRSGPSTLSVAGTLDSALDLRLDLDSPDLASLFPGATGRVQATGSVSGAVGAPRLHLDLSARDVALAGRGVAHLSAVADLDLAPEGRLEIRVDGQDLLVDDRRWTRLSIRGEGRRADHRLSLSLAGDPLSAELDLAGGLDGTGSYRGRLTRLRLDSPDFGIWDLRQPSPVDVIWPTFAAGPLCLGHDRGSGGCLEISRAESAALTIGVALDRLDLDLLAPLLPKMLALEGQAALGGRFVAAGSLLDGRATATLSRARLTLPSARGPGQSIEMSGARLDVESAAGGLRGRLAVPLAGLGQADADLELAGWRLDDPARPAQPLAGRIRARLDGLERFGDPIPQLSRLRGNLSADIRLGGTLGQPGVRGEIRAERGGFNVPLLGLDVASLNLLANVASADRIRLSGGADVGGGRLEIDGDGGFGPDGPSARIRATGERLVLVDTSEYFVGVSPRLDVDATARGAQVRGEILIPDARINPRALPEGTVRPSNDVVVKGTDRPPPYPIDLAIELRVGEAVNMDAFGLTGRLAGHLSLIQAPGRDLLGDGQLQILGGQYRIPTGLGLAANLVAPLRISRGQLVWVRNPIRNPGLLFLAERGTGRTTANVRVIGTLADPQFAFFSNTDPAMTQSEAITFLVTGIAPSGADADHSASLAFGRYIAPGTFLEYETGLGDARNRFRLRRNLTDRIQLEAQSGENQSLDVFWTFEHAASDRRPHDAPAEESIEPERQPPDARRAAPR